MFLNREDIKEKIQNIILDENDNDIAFIIASKGIGKLNLLGELYGLESSNKEIIIANGKRVRNSSSCLVKCYIDGICSYLEKNNSRKTRENFLRQLPRERLSITQKISLIVVSLLHEGLNPINLCLMANQEISNETYYDLQKIVASIYPNTKSEYDERLVLPYDGRLLWVDALAYYIALCEGIDDAIIQTQRFFFDVIAHARYFKQGSPTREKFMSFLRNNERESRNLFAKDFASYYSSFVTFAKNFSSKEQFEKNSKDNSELAIELLDRALLEFSDEDVDSSIKLLGEIYEESQVCAILDICLETITRFFEKHKASNNLKATTVISISRFQTLCISAAYQWLDLTLLDKLVELQKSIQTAGYSIKIDYKELMYSGKRMLFDYFKKEIEKEHG